MTAICNINSIGIEHALLLHLSSSSSSHRRHQLFLLPNAAAFSAPKTEHHIFKYTTYHQHCLRHKESHQVLIIHCIIQHIEITVVNHHRIIISSSSSFIFVIVVVCCLVFLFLMFWLKVLKRFHFSKFISTIRQVVLSGADSSYDFTRCWQKQRCCMHVTGCNNITDLHY